MVPTFTVTVTFALVPVLSPSALTWSYVYASVAEPPSLIICLSTAAVSLILDAVESPDPPPRNGMSIVVIRPPVLLNALSLRTDVSSSTS